MKRSRGKRSKSRHLMKKKKATTIIRSLQEFDQGEKVNIVIDSSIHKGMPHPRFHGYTGEVEGKRGNSYLIGINDGGKRKKLIVRPEHLKGVK